MGATQGLAPELVTLPWSGGRGGDVRHGMKGHQLYFLQHSKRTSSSPCSPGLVHAEPEKVRDQDSGAPNHSEQVSRAPPLFLECKSRPRPTPQSHTQSSQAESSLSLGWGGNRMWGGEPHPSCLGGGLPPPFFSSSSCELAGAGLVPRALPYKAKKCWKAAVIRGRRGQAGPGLGKGGGMGRGHPTSQSLNS